MPTRADDHGPTDAPEPVSVSVPELSLVVLLGAAGSGTTTFAARHFAAAEVLSADTFRAMLGDAVPAGSPSTDPDIDRDALEALRFVAGRRLAAGRLTVVDAPDLRPDERKALTALARAHDVPAVAIVLDPPLQVCIDRIAARPGHDVAPRAVRRQRDELHRALGGLTRERFDQVTVLNGEDDAASARVVRTRLTTDLRHEPGPFDVVGDVHGCLDELLDLLTALGWSLRRDGEGRAVGATHPQGRRAVFVGDLVDRGPDTPGVLRLVMGMVADGTALCVAGNHEDKLVRALRGRAVTVGSGLERSLEQLARESEGFRADVARFCDGLLSHHVLDGGALVVAHAGLLERYHHRWSRRVRSFALYGDTGSRETDEYGLPVRLPWADDYRGAATVLYGHTPTPAPEWVNNTFCLDTGCAFGGHLTAMRWPEKEFVAVPARAVHYPSARPFPTAAEQPFPTAAEQPFPDAAGGR